MENDLLSCYVESPNNDLLKMVVSKYYSFVYSTCFRVLERSDLADDATQATFLILSKKASSLKPTEKLISWLHRTAYLSALWLRRQEKQRMKREQKKPITKVEFSPEEAFDKKNLKTCIDLAINQMSERYRTPILLKFYEEKSNQEIGLILKISEEAVRKKVQRGLLKLESLLKTNKVQVSIDMLLIFLGQRMIETTPSANLTNLLSGCDNLGSISEWNRPAFEIFKGVEKMLFLSKIKTVFIIVNLFILISAFSFVYLNGEDNSLPIIKDKTEVKPLKAEATVIKPINMDYEYNLFLAESDKKIGSWTFKVQEIEGFDVTIEIFTYELDNKKFQSTKRVYYKIKKNLFPIKVELEIFIDGNKCLSGIANIVNDTIAWKGFKDKKLIESYNTFERYDNYYNADILGVKFAGLVVASDLPFIGPLLMKDKGTKNGFRFMVFPESITYSLSYLNGIVLEKASSNENGFFSINILDFNSKIIAEYKFDKDGRLATEFKIDKFTLRKADK